MREVNGVEELARLANTDLGTTEGVVVDQATIDAFADATGDHQWIHVDPDAAAAGPFGTTVAHGYLTLALVPVLLRQLIQIRGVSHGLNYGIDRVRFPAPLRSGSTVRATANVGKVKEIEGGVQPTFVVSIIADGQERPVCVAEVIYRYLA